MYDLDFQGQLLRSDNAFSFIYIPDLENARIYPGIKSVSCLQPDMRKVIPKFWPLFSRSNTQTSWPSSLINIFLILNIGNVRIDTKSIHVYSQNKARSFMQ